MSKLQKISNTHYRIVCDCGEYHHEVKQDERGEIVLTSFVTGKKKEAPQPPRDDAEPKNERRRKKNLFGTLLETASEEGED